MLRLSTQLLATAVLLAFASSASSQSTMRVSRTSEGLQANGPSVLASISNDGHFVTYVSSASNIVSDDTNGVDDVFVYDQNTGAMRMYAMPSEFSACRLIQPATASAMI